tara:strand:+ start:403 stop:537 length:135 start_codon:yes stop_codon:yes gene_type:complete
MIVKINNTQRAAIGRLANKNNISAKEIIEMLLTPEGRIALGKLK